MSFFVAGPSRTGVSAPQRPLVLIATLGGAVAALVSLGICLVVGVFGWYLTDAGAHGTATSGMRVGAVGWLMGHGTGLNLAGVTIGPVPLGITALIIWVTWQVGLRVGGAVANHGPDADGIADGSRDLVVPTAGLLFVFGYMVVALITATLAAGGGPISLSEAMSGAVPVALFVGLPAIALDSGRLAQWLQDVPEDLRGMWSGVRGLLVGWFLVSAVAFLILLVFNGATAINMISAMHIRGGSVVAYIGALLLFLPNAIVFMGSYLLCAPYTLGIGTTVSPGTVHLAPRPAIPWLAATPTTASGWFYLIALLPVAVAVVVAFRLERRTPAPSVFAAAVRAAAYALVASVAIGALGWWAGGAIGTGGMQSFGTSAGSMFIHALEWIAAPSIVVAAAVAWWDVRASRADH